MHTDAQLTVSHHLQKSSDAMMKSYVYRPARLEYAFDGVLHRGLLYKLKSIAVGGCVLSICR